MKLFLVRHGESLGNVDKTIHAELSDHAIPLSEKGVIQAEQAGQFLRKYFEKEFAGRELPPLRIWTSPYKRTRQTAQAIEHALNGFPVSVREHINLCEQQFGLFDGIPDDELPILFQKEHAHYSKCEDHEGKFWARMPLGESRFDVAVRIRQVFGTFRHDAKRHGIENVIIICHGVSLRAFVMQWLHLTPEWFDAEPNPGNSWIRLIEDEEDKGYIYKDG